MKYRISLPAIALVLVGVFAVHPSGAQELPQQDKQEHHQYRFVDLGTLGGSNSYLPGPFFEGLAAQSLSAAGKFAGTGDTATPDPFAPICFNADCLVSHAFQWRDGILTDLGALPGQGDLSSAATWISNNGFIAGLSENGEIDPLLPGFPELRAVLWKHGKITDLGTLGGGYESIASSVNARGHVVGFATNTVPDDYSFVGLPTQARAFRWMNGVMHDLGTLPGGTDAVALFINESDQIVGQSYTADSIPPPTLSCSDFPLTLHGFFWENGKMVDIGTLGGSCTFVYGLNNWGQIVGQSTLSGDQTSHPYIWDPHKKRNKMTDLGTLGGTYGYATWINDSGSVVGLATPQGDQALIAFLWKHGTISSLGALSGNGCSSANAINSQGQIVGGSGFNSADSFADCNDPVEHAVLWENGKILDLNNFVPPGNDLTLNEAVFINDRGEISGFGTLSNGDQHAFLLLPCENRDHDDSAGCNAQNPSSVSANVTPSAPSPVSRIRPGSIPSRLRQMLHRPLKSDAVEPDACTRCCGQCRILLSPTSLTFKTEVGKQSSAKAVALINETTTAQTVHTISIAGPFTQKNNCPRSLLPGHSCQIHVRFVPQTKGPASGTLSVSGGGFSLHATLNGVGVILGADATLSPASLSFGNQLFDTTSPAQAVSLSNYGKSVLSVSSITTSANFGESSNCAETLASGATCLISVTFTPSHTGGLSGALSITDNAPNSPQTASLTGTGVAGQCLPIGQQCRPGYECCPGLTCRPASTRAFCEP